MKKRLTAIMLVYMDGLSEKKKAQMDKYLENKLEGVVDYYWRMLKNKDRKNMPLPTMPDKKAAIDVNAQDAESEIQKHHENDPLVDPEKETKLIFHPDERNIPTKESDENVLNPSPN